MNKIYVPDLSNYKCIVVRNDSTIRAYKEVPANNREVSYRDYFYTSNYLYQDGTQSFSNYTTLPVCIDTANLTDNYYYRNDFPNILIMFSIISIVGIYLPYRIFSHLCRRIFK